MTVHVILLCILTLVNPGENDCCHWKLFLLPKPSGSTVSPKMNDVNRIVRQPAVTPNSKKEKRFKLYIYSHINNFDGFTSAQEHKVT
ncbi:hypothetical protein AMELA_G00092370 [Ameiurus melas]|uniref:Uncharacterized protein n=1 Tax=Ameiurus melas TaxID=219545 RepID=A0A7J6AWY5_AMEME|nr:hypothetical protein AMELA_G00092370 [Ameiurus melas]